MTKPHSDRLNSALGAPDWRPVKGEPDWVFDRYQASPWPNFIRHLFDLHKLQPEDRRFDAHETPIKLPD